MNVQAYDPSLAHGVVALWRASFEYGVGIIDDHPIDEQYAHFVEQVVPNNTVKVAVDCGAIVGFIASTSESVAHLYVRVQNVRQGIGSHLLNLAKDESSGSLWLYTFAQNRNARRFYERHGFIEGEHESENMWKLEAIKYHWARVENAV
jgi:GNAT superfamily N-acetyltransferase